MYTDLRIYHEIEAELTPVETQQNSGIGDPATFKALAVAVAEGFRVLSQGAEGGWCDDVGGAICWHSASYVPVFNGAGLFSEHLFNKSTLSAISDYFAERGRPYALVTVDGLVPDAVQ